ncbi:hypothetical protein BX666DRAFT_2031136 [Dichotomocladium elegans]|nr:hypothetical protein BX666DRAFT_2031136 [Dichotomocladium elegans]
MDKSLFDYEQSLEALERQREELELVMQRMGKEWEESGPGIGWLGTLKLPSREPSPSAGPSLMYLGSLLNVNEDLLSESFANVSTSPSEQKQQEQHSEEALQGYPLDLATPGDEAGNEPPLELEKSIAQSTTYVVSPPVTPDESLHNPSIDQSLLP